MAPNPNRLLTDCALVGVVGCLVALVANAVSPHGLSLTRDYFPETPRAASPSSAGTPPFATPVTGARARDASTSPTPARTKRGLPLASTDEVLALFRDARYAAGQTAFVDARDDEHYRAAHIPGAYQFDHYHPDRYVANVLGPLQIADRIVVYCNGGDCEDSELAALDLESFGVPADKIVIFGGGLPEWKARNLPLEAGVRGSGKGVTP